MSKRQHLQGIRGLAIISVLGFHFYPSIFPNGYLGVDQFFVLSGFLMCMLLSRTSHLENLEILTTFYSRRFKRILPLYLAVITLALLLLFTIFPDSAIETNKGSAFKSLLFMSNRPDSVDEEYFKMLVQAVNIFAHTWSLSVEIQFYFIIPILFIVCKRFSPKIQAGFYILLGILSFIFHIKSTSEVSFNNTFARAWQFLLGTILSLLGNEKSSTLENKSKTEINQHAKYLSLITVIYINFTSIPLPDFFVRPTVTILTAIVIFYPCDDQILGNRILVYIGDISFCLYLIHWPIYSYWKLTMDDNKLELFGLLIISILLSILIFETYEKWYLGLTNVQVIFLIGTLFVFNFILIHKDSIYTQQELTRSNSATYFKVLNNMTVDDAIKWNFQWSGGDQRTLYHSNCKYTVDTQFKWCNFTDYEKKGKFDILIFGNSWAANLGKLIFEECNHKARNMVLGTTFGCEALYPSRNLTVCYQNLKQMDEHVNNLNVDYGFMISRMISADGKLTNDDLEKDSIYLTMKSQLSKYMKRIKKKIFFLDSIPPVHRNMVAEIGPLLKSGASVKTVNNMLVNTTTYELMRRRNAKLIEFCGEKCERIDYLNHFYNNNTKQFHYFDRLGFSYLTRVNHFSPYGLEYTRKFYTNICDKL